MRQIKIFVADARFDAQCLRAFAVIGNTSRESLVIDVGQRFKREHVVNILNRTITARVLLATIHVDDGTQLMSKVMKKQAC